MQLKYYFLDSSSKMEWPSRLLPALHLVVDTCERRRRKSTFFAQEQMQLGRGVATVELWYGHKIFLQFPIWFLGSCWSVLPSTAYAGMLFQPQGLGVFVRCTHSIEWWRRKRDWIKSCDEWGSLRWIFSLIFSMQLWLCTVELFFLA